MKKLRGRSGLVVIFIALSLFVYPPSKAWARSGCFWITAGEIFVPGLGYGVSGQFDKMLLFGGGRWLAANQYANTSASPDYQQNPNEIYKTTSAKDSDSGKVETRVYLTQATYEARYYAYLESNLTLISWGDLYQHSCDANTETYRWVAAPFLFNQFYDNWMFWVPMAVLASNAATFNDTQLVEYHLSRGLTQSRMRRDEFGHFYMVGLGEEMLFRGTFQHYFYETMNDSWGWGKEPSRHMSVVAASAVFGAAHTGMGFSADTASAFLMGLYLGYSYMPGPDEFDLTTAIAIHAWWDIVLSYTIMNNAHFTEENPTLEVPIFAIGFKY
ncbi:MAG: hypothetical protein A2508_01265 [Candidatus Lambdaproteobacteria bacterium RIFOXYD12_FULL_49_8]|nr:MAG: hypothetical protein A2508_01265 [Candidatus Lambdaproteobacteria bacterium RIFOXYD12_FULL_49_8]